VIRSSHRTAVARRVVVLAIAALIPALAGCEAGVDAPTQDWHQTTDGSDATIGKITIDDAFVLGAPLGSTVAAGRSAGLFFALTNTGPADKLVRVTAPGTAKSVLLSGGTVNVASQQSVLLTGPAPKVVLEDLTKSLTGGSTVRLVMTFQNAASVTLTVPVMPAAQYYSTFSAPPSPTPSPSRKAKAGATPTPSASPSASASPSPSTSP
jgi:copper(I)-binding protein